MRARVVSIFKKGDPKKLANYRPISLLNSFYKIYAALIQRRLAEAIDKELSETQFAFRKNRSTSIPIACLRRIVDRAEATKEKYV